MYMLSPWYYMLFSYQTGYIMWHSRLRIYIPWGAVHLYHGKIIYIYIMARAFTSISWREHLHLYHGESIYIYIMARTFTSISWREHLHLYHGESIYIYIMGRAFTSISWGEHLHLYHGESIYIYIIVRAYTSISWREHIIHLYHGDRCICSHHDIDVNALAMI
jgi:hypothetical protein